MLSLFLQKTQREGVSAWELHVLLALPTGPLSRRSGHAPGFAARRRAVPEAIHFRVSFQARAPGEEVVKRTRGGILLGRARGRRLRVRHGSFRHGWRAAGFQEAGGGLGEALGAPRACGNPGWSRGPGGAREANTALGRLGRGPEQGPRRRDRAAPPRWELEMTLAKSPGGSPSRRRGVRVDCLEVLRFRDGNLSGEREACWTPG